MANTWRVHRFQNGIWATANTARSVNMRVCKQAARCTVREISSQCRPASIAETAEERIVDIALGVDGP